MQDRLVRSGGICHVSAAIHRTIYLSGIESQVSLQCAKSLDLPTGDGRRIRLRLIALFGSMDALVRVVASHAPRVC